MFPNYCLLGFYRALSNLLLFLFFIISTLCIWLEENHFGQQENDVGKQLVALMDFLDDILSEASMQVYGWCKSS